jgi:hypothetical protein
MHGTRQNAVWWLVLLFVAPLLSGCELAGDIFKLGVWSGVLMIGLLAALVVLVLSFMRRT